MKRPAEESEGVPGAIGLIAVALLGAGALAAVWVLYTRAPSTLVPVSVPAAPAGPYAAPRLSASLPAPAPVPTAGPFTGAPVPSPFATVGASGLEPSDIELRVDVSSWTAWPAGEQITNALRSLLDLRSGGAAVTDTRTSVLELAPDLGADGHVLLAAFGGPFETLSGDERRLLAEDLAIALSPLLRTSAFASFTSVQVVFVDRTGGAPAVFVVERDAGDATVLVAREEQP